MPVIMLDVTILGIICDVIQLGGNIALLFIHICMHSFALSHWNYNLVQSLENIVQYAYSCKNE